MSSKRFFRIPVSWTMIADMKIEAETLEEAIKIARDTDSLPDDGDYLDSSFEVNEESAEALAEIDGDYEDYEHGSDAAEA